MPRDAIVVAILGKRGYGKTTRLRERFRNAPRVVAWDPAVTKQHPRGQLELAHRFTDAHECADWIRRHPGLLRCALHSFDPDDFGPLVEAVHDSGEPTLFAVDEISTLCRNHQTVDAAAWLVSYGRLYGHDLYWTARRPAEVSHLLTGQAEIIECFKTSSTADLDALRGAFSAEQVRRIPTLERFEFVSTEDA